MESRYGDLARPDRLPKPACRVMLICGPPGAGKSSYVRERARLSDSVIDIDEIARRFGYDRERPSNATATLLTERNERLAVLATMPADHVAWVIIGAPSRKLRTWWCDQLNVAKGDLVLLVPSRAELIRRITKDPDRRFVSELHIELVDQWFALERENSVGRFVPGCDANGCPTDPLHPWNA